MMGYVVLPVLILYTQRQEIENKAAQAGRDIQDHRSDKIFECMRSNLISRTRLGCSVLELVQN